jgi:CubicO group peptidase (beta-lactamase class C family)
MRTSNRVFVSTLTVLFSSVTFGADEPPNFREIVQPYVDEGRIAGASGVVVTEAGIVAFPTAGYADLETKRPMQKDTLFWIASTTKIFEATALMMLVDDGKVSLDAPVSKYLPGFAPRIAVKGTDGKETLRAPAREMTVRMLLNHTNGLRYVEGDMPPTDCCSLEALVKRFVSLPLMFEPGSRFGYSNAGPDTASRIVEVVSGKDFENFLDERLLRPLGMRDTSFFPTKEQVSRLAITYMYSQELKKLVPAPNEIFITKPYDDRRVRRGPGGGLFSTGEDLALFAQMFLRNGELGGRRYLSEAAVAEMTRNQLSAEAAASIPQPPRSPDAPATYGLGWGVGATGANFHPGVASTDIRISSTRQFASILLAQHAPDATIFEMSLRLIDALERHFASP